MFCHFISDLKRTGIRVPDAGGIDLTDFICKVEQIGGFHHSCFVLKLSVADPGPGAFLTPGSRIWVG
jgi:hypothetical protein